MQLTIAIPTFNRPKELARSLRTLLPQVSDEWVLRIHDNCSEQPAAEVHRELLAAFGPERVTVVRNLANLGASANVLRCFEQCTTEWLVVLGDDDEPAADYVAAILEAIRQHPEAIYGTFSTSIFARSHDVFSDGLPGFIRAIDNWSNVLFVSCCYFNRARLVPYLRYGYLYAYSLAPHIAMLLRYLREHGGRCCFYRRNLVRQATAEDGVTWSRVNVSNPALLLELVPDRASQEIFFQAMAPHFFPLPMLAMRLVERSTETGEDSELLFRFRALTTTCLRPRLRSALARAILSFLVARPRLAQGLGSIVRKLSGRVRTHRTEADIHAGL